MCRIAGIVDLSSSFDLSQSIIAMRDSMHRGGPDDAGVLIDEGFRLALGHRRLSLLDLSPGGHQPMRDSNSDNIIIFNGEIYNFLEIKEDLVSKGYQFKTTSDTEVILAAYHAYGSKCFEKFNGMFALCIWDRAKFKIVVLARDHAGIKPLYIYLSEKQLIFASEIRSFKKLTKNWEEDEKWKIALLTFGHLPEAITTLKNVFPLRKGTYLEISLSNLKARYHTFNKFEFSSLITNLDEAVNLVREKLELAVKRHLISDAPIGLFLSGGIDSSLLTLIASKYVGKNLKTLSIVFDDATLNEAPYQKLIIDRTRSHHHSFLVTENEFKEDFSDILLAMDQPSTDGINSYFISKFARKYGLTAVLSGLGADEIFGGYPSFNNTNTYKLVKKFPRILTSLCELSPNDKLKKVAFAERNDVIGEYLFTRGFYTPSTVAKLLDTSVSEVNDVLSEVRFEKLPLNLNDKDRVSALETSLYMQNQLLKDTDYMSMWHSLEVRVPFLDKDLMNAAYAIAPEIKYDNKVGKHLLIKAFSDVLPKEIWQRKKQGFTFPFHKWMQNVELNATDKHYKKLENSFKVGKCHWSRYWAYLLTKKQDITLKKIEDKRICFLNLTTFSTTGGIEKYNRAFLKALTKMQTEGITSNSISLHDTTVDDRYFAADKYFCFEGNKLKFIKTTVLNAAKYDTIVIGHINLAIPALIIKKLYPKKQLILVAHGIEVWGSLTRPKKLLLNSVDKILAVSSFTKAKIIEIQNVSAEKIIILHNTVDPYFKIPNDFMKPAYLKNRYGIHNGQKIIYTFTRMSSSEQYKGYDKIIEILPELKLVFEDIKYIIGGKADKQEKERIKKLIKEKGLEDSVVFAGFIDDEEVTDHFKLADLFVMPSSKEGFGIVFLEAMASGLRVVGGNIDGTVDALQNGKLGTLLNPLDAEELKNGIITQLNKTTGDEDSIKLQKDVLHSFSFPKYTDRLKEILLN